MDVCKTQAQKMMEFITKNVYFTCQDIMRITKTTAPHNVVRRLKKNCKIADELIHRYDIIDDGKGNKARVYKQYKQYKYEGLLDNAG